MGRRKRHPLSRYANSATFQLSDVGPIAKTLSDKEASFDKQFSVAWEFYGLVLHGDWAHQGEYRWQLESKVECEQRIDDESFQYLMATKRLEMLDERCPPDIPVSDQLIVHRLSWFKALSQKLQDNGHLSPDITPELVFEMIDQFHSLPLQLNCGSIMADLCSDRWHVSFEHILRLVRFAPAKLTTTSTLAAAFASHKKLTDYCGSFAAQAVKNQWSPKQLENAIKKSRGARGAGRPPKTPRIHN